MTLYKIKKIKDKVLMICDNCGKVIRVKEDIYVNRKEVCSCDYIEFLDDGTTPTPENLICFENNQKNIETETINRIKRYRKIRTY